MWKINSAQKIFERILTTDSLGWELTTIWDIETDNTATWYKTCSVWFIDQLRCRCLSWEKNKCDGLNSSYLFCYLSVLPPQWPACVSVFALICVDCYESWSCSEHCVDMSNDTLVLLHMWGVTSLITMIQPITPILSTTPPQWRPSRTAENFISILSIKQNPSWAKLESNQTWIWFKT